jgi:hypothetical protein
VDPNRDVYLELSLTVSGALKKLDDKIGGLKKQIRITNKQDHFNTHMKK